MEVAILIGLQASGKTTFYRERLAESHVLVSKDRMKNARSKAERQARDIAAALEAGHNVAVDNTNISRDARAPILKQARSYGARTVGYFFESDLDACLRRNDRRKGAACIPRPGVVATLYRLELPRLSEGFDALWDVRLIPGGFEVKHWQK
jgi:predicted kinase